MLLFTKRLLAAAPTFMLLRWNIDGFDGSGLPWEGEDG
jgi:hypothetical protein